MSNPDFSISRNESPRKVFFKNREPRSDKQAGFSSETRGGIRESMNRQMRTMANTFSNKRILPLATRFVTFENETFLANNVHLDRGGQIQRLDGLRNL